MGMKDYHVEWKEQSKHSAESMPVGGGNIGVNVWVESNQLFIYMQQSGWFDENNSMLKAGRVRIDIEPCPFEQLFRQELILEDGYVRISGKEFYMNIWVDVNQPVICLDYESVIERKIKLTYETWRYADREVNNCSYELFQCKEVFFYPLKNPVFHKDTIIPEKEYLFFYHKNDNNDISFYKEMADQGLDAFSEEVYNPQKDLVSGGIVKGDGLVYVGTVQGKYQDTSYIGYQYSQEEAQRFGAIAIVLDSIKTGNENELKTRLEEILCNHESNRVRNFQRSKKWWNDYFSNTFIKGDPTQTVYFEILKNYQLFRYMLGCNYYGFWPTKFNGGLFTFDPSLGGDSPWSDDKLEYTPDFRLWGGGSHTIQNQRLLYWPMLKTGDADVMKQHFDFFNRTLLTSKLRCKKSFDIDGAIFPEQVGTYGLCCGCDNEWGNKSGLPVSQIKYNFSNSLETILMILEYYRFTQKDISEYIPLMENIILFYHHFYDKDDEDGKMIMYPANALETYHVVKNPVDGIAGLQVVVKRMLELPDDLLSEEKKQTLKLIQKRIPPIRISEKEHHQIIAYSDSTGILHNCEIPELYPVFPYGLFGIGKKNRKLAVNTAKYAWQEKEQLSFVSWHPTGIQYARLGMLQECEDFLVHKMRNGDFRFPAFWGPGHDWTPDHNWGGSGMIQLQEMLLQTDNDELRILPCWNLNINIHFRLYAPNKTIVECNYKDGQILKLHISPKEREKDVILPEGVVYEDFKQ